MTATLTAIIRAKPGAEAKVRNALLKVGEHVQAYEPGTLDYFVAQDPADPTRFTTYERFKDLAAMTAHNEGPGSKTFFAEAGDLLEGPVTIVTAEEIFSR